MPAASLPEHRVSAAPSPAHVTVSVGGTPVAASDRAVALEETGYPVRYYLPPEDVDFRRLEPSGLHTRCPFKGTADYWSFTPPPDTDGAAAVRVADVAWSYPEPIPSVAAIRGHLAFGGAAAEITVDGVRQAAD